MVDFALVTLVYLKCFGDIISQYFNVYIPDLCYCLVDLFLSTRSYFFMDQYMKSCCFFHCILTPVIICRMIFFVVFLQSYYFNNNTLNNFFLTGLYSGLEHKGNLQRWSGKTVNVSVLKHVHIYTSIHLKLMCQAWAFLRVTMQYLSFHSVAD